MAEEAAAALALERVLLVPAGTPPHKLGVPLTDAAHRLAMLEIAVTGNDRFAVSRADLDRPGPHFTVDTLDVVRSACGLGRRDTLWFILGADSLEDLPTWRDPPGIVARARLAVVGRPGHTPDLAVLEAEIPGVAARVDPVAAPLIGVSGTDIRRRVAEGRTIRYHVPDAVADYIRVHDLYRPPPGSAPAAARGAPTRA
jgi:nicotinate-nucleotide adenylyltransferase